MAMPFTTSESPSPPEASAALATCRLAASAEELAAHHALRRQVFVVEQAIFAGDDADERDRADTTLHAVGIAAGRVRGVVRLYPLDREGRRWKGDRLAVAPECRATHLGADLVRFAVRTAGELGGSEMVAHIQLANVAFFTKLGWRAVGGPAPFHGVEHQLMRIALSGPAKR
jgi:putative N-acetyltransferase (TIGR04045 family)